MAPFRRGGEEKGGGREIAFNDIFLLYFFVFWGFSTFFFATVLFAGREGRSARLGEFRIGTMEKGSWEAVRFPINIWEKVVGAS